MGQKRLSKIFVPVAASVVIIAMGFFYYFATNKNVTSKNSGVDPVSNSVSDLPIYTSGRTGEKIIAYNTGVSWEQGERRELGDISSIPTTLYVGLQPGTQSGWTPTNYPPEWRKVTSSTGGYILYIPQDDDIREIGNDMYIGYNLDPGSELGEQWASVIISTGSMTIDMFRSQLDDIVVRDGQGIEHPAYEEAPWQARFQDAVLYDFWGDSNYHVNSNYVFVDRGDRTHILYSSRGELESRIISTMQFFE